MIQIQVQHAGIQRIYEMYPGGYTKNIMWYTLEYPGGFIRVSKSINEEWGYIRIYKRYPLV